MTYTTADYEQAVAAIRQHTTIQPRIGLVLGSGLGTLADTLENAVAIPYAEIPGWPASTVHGHAGRLVIGELSGQQVVAQQGRAHFYEGYTMQQITFPIRVMHFLGVQTLILTNAAGGVDPSFSVGDVMLINDHINFPGMTGSNPLMGPNDDAIGPRFVGLAQAYDREMRGIARDVAREANIPLHEGVYAAVSGPSFETPAEIRMLRTIGANAVGMSTVHEVLVARHAGMRVMACSGITNVAIDHVDSELETNHEEVLEAGKVIVPRLKTIVTGVLSALA
ncbi:purine-nucleoside phosphorylase [Phototrophicus methaneseepsis]|uniref:Purine nucleoside phosphorylase n=1 Tax=Phototrophicus methaneseepsis TaxID=2710758 RepID=A0A7S8E6Y0_9CHLR|nr:purine-nucleoside phosphorylase [Phototrophicus methaneseepsis]QPC81482.1 purine-nucleoside phosphorylase [Phototrophicus methaneseepsis]